MSAVTALAISDRYLHKRSMSANAGTGALIKPAAQAEAEGLWTVRAVDGARWRQAGFRCSGVSRLFRRFGRPMRDHIGDEPD